MARHKLSSAFSPALRRLFPAVSSRQRVRPCLEALEDRITPTTFAPTTFVDDGSVNSLRGAITETNADTGTATDTIQLKAGTYTLSLPNSGNQHEQANASGDLNITSSRHALVIEGATDAKGNPTTLIEQAVADRVFQIVNPGTTVTFKDLEIVAGQAQENGGAGVAAGSTDALGGGILDDGGNITLTSVVLLNNSAHASSSFNADGGGIYVGQGGSLTVQSSTIESNSALGGVGGGGGNGGNAAGGGVYASGPTVIANSTLLDNAVTGGDGSPSADQGAIGFGGNALGGGIFATGPTTLTGSTLDGNSVNGGSGSHNGGGSAEGGGAYFATGSTATLTNCSVASNVVAGGAGSLTNFDHLEGDVGGGALGGGVYAGGQSTIVASTLAGNALYGGKGILDNRSSTVSADVGGEALGGGIFALGSTTITTSVLTENLLTGGAGDYLSGTVSGFVGGSASGGGLYFSGNSAAITASTLSGNFVGGGSGSAGGDLATAGSAEGGGAYVGGGSITLVNSTIANNKVVAEKGIPRNPAASGGGLLFGVTAAATLTNVTVAGNTAALPPTAQGGTSGGGITITGPTVTLVNTLVALNGATTGPDVAGFAATGSGHNLIGNSDGSSGFSAAHGDLLGSSANPLNPQLGPLQNNGGPTPTMAIALDSPAFNAGDNSAQSVTGPFDQRGQGFDRVERNVIDIGAFEVQLPLIHLPPPGLPPTLRVPFLLALFDSFLHGVETGNGQGIWTVTDSFLGIPLLVSNYDSAGNLMNVHLFGFNVTALFEL